MTVAPSADMLRLLGGFQISQALYVTARAKVADHLLAGPLPLPALAAATGLDAAPLGRLLRTLAAEGVFTVEPDDDPDGEDPDGEPDGAAHGPLVGLGPLGRTLASDTPESLRNVALTWMETHYLAFAELWHTARDGVPAAERAYGRPFFDWLGEDPERVATFTAAMADFARLRRDALDAVEVDGARTVVDVGGADGTVLAALARRHPQVRGIVFDLPHVVAAAPPLLRAQGVADRVEAQGGDFFTAVPAGDCYLACFILHDWDDEQAGRILARIHQAATPQARLVLVDTVLGEGALPQVATLLDLTMLGMLGGRERSAADWRHLLTAHGFQLDRIRPTAGPMCVLEATRAA
ncbi:methyltransferase [Kitasatospora sp. LaBMicrA B282]|uniref:methyltransferase n=1 Tax=Kitasatospora sp. LaBMicrA B282 TaxID=3420949 RepID=UPI003D1138B5